ncbi:MAG: hypothetical protein H7144_11440 [Burkholderiales bacterium]|nr:hypothetical protein [Phycisphaerae bacterium]
MIASRVRFVPFILAACVVGVPMIATAQDAPAAGAPAAAAAGITGTWTWQQQGRNGAQEVVLKLKQEGEKVTGTVTGQGNQELELQEGTFKGNTLAFKVVRDMNGQKTTTTYTATITGDTIKGKSEQVSTREIDGKRTAQ